MPAKMEGNDPSPMSSSMEPGQVSNAPTNEAAIEFALTYLKLLGARLERPRPGVIRTELDRDQVCELEDRPLGTWYTMQSIPDLTTLYLGLHDHHAVPSDFDSPSSVENIGLHGHRLRQMLASTWRIGHVSRLRVVPRQTTERQLYRPIALFGFEVGRFCNQRMTWPHPVAVDLVDG